MTTTSKKPLSTAWYNIIRRQLRANPPTYRGDPPSCPDCDGSTSLREGRYGRYYACDHYGCKGTHGAHLDGTPRRRKPESQLLVETRAAIRQLVVYLECHARLHVRLEFMPIDGPMGLYNTIYDICSEAGVGGPHLAPFVRARHGLGLRFRSEEELVAIRAAAEKILREERGTAWDHLMLDVMSETDHTGEVMVNTVCN